MKKEFIKRALRGFPQGVVIGYVIAICFSLSIGDGNYYACSSELIETFGSEMTAVVVQFVCSGILGAIFAGGTVVYEIDSWSIARQSAVYFLIGSLAMMPIGYLMNWMERSFWGFVLYFFVFVVIWLICWLVNYIFWRLRIKKLNNKVSQLNK